MKKLYLVFLMLLILFIPTTHAVAVYQLDQPINELNGYTLREVFEDGNYLRGNDINETIFGVNYVRQNYDEFLFNGSSTSNYSMVWVPTQIYNGYIYQRIQFIQGNTSNNNSPTLQLDSTKPIDYNNKTRIDNYINYNNSWRSFNSNMVTYDSLLIKLYAINLTIYGIDNLTLEQMDIYYNLYLEAVRFEQENIEASKDEGGYQNIFKSIINGVKGLITEMGYVWQFLNAPILTSDMQDYSFSIDWSWDLIGVVRQIINSLAILILQTNFIFINVLLSFTGIPIQVSILTLLFSNFVFVLLGWIIVKSFII